VKPCGERRLIDRHFAGSIRPRDELRLREHLFGCESCRRYYERHQILAKLDPFALPGEERMALALGVRSSRRAPAQAAWLVAATLAACLAFLLLRPSDPAQQFAARGIAAEPRVWVYRVPAQGKPVELGTLMAPTDELAFAYDNPEQSGRLLIFGIDEHRHVYWYHPAWVDPQSAPAAVPIGAGRRELPEAVAHELDGSELTLYAVFTNDAVTVRDVERDLESFTGRAAWTHEVRVAR
jgi:hypothetical protein